MAERIVVVGHAAVTCLGRDMDATWDGLIARPIRASAATPSLGPEPFLQDVARHGRRLRAGDAPAKTRRSPSSGPRSIHLALAAAREAWADAGLERRRRRPRSGRRGRRLGVRRAGPPRRRAGPDGASGESLATSPLPGPGPDHQPGGRPDRAAPRTVRAERRAGQCLRLGGHAIALGAMFLRAGEADLALCGAGESAFTPPIVNGFATMKALLGRKPERPLGRRPRRRRAGRSASTAPGSSCRRGPGCSSWPPSRPRTRLGLTLQAELAG